jgi:hypothetical protein
MVTTTNQATGAELYANALEFKRRVKERREALLVEGGFSKENADGDEVADPEAFKAEAAIIASGREVDDPDRDFEGYTDEEILAEVLDVEVDEDDPVDRAAMEYLAKRIGGILQTGPNGYVQRALSKGKVLIRKDAYRGKTKTKVRVSFVTTHHGIIVDDSLLPVLDKTLRESVKLHDQAAMIVGRVPELGPQVNKAITSGMKRASDNARVSVPELEAGESDSK